MSEGRLTEGRSAIKPKEHVKQIDQNCFKIRVNIGNGILHKLNEPLAIKQTTTRTIKSNNQPGSNA